MATVKTNKDAVNRHTGGLEIMTMATRLKQIVNRHTGGLEKRKPINR